MKIVLSAMWIAAAIAQTPAPETSIGGVVRDAGSGEPLADCTVSTAVNARWVGDTIFQNSATRQVQATTDAQGRYRLSGLPPGTYRVDARQSTRFGPQVTRTITLAGRDLDNVDFRLVADGAIAGKVVDENQEPVPGMTVFLVSREYYLGSLGYFFKGVAHTDDLGRYSLATVPAGRPYVLLAEKRERNLRALSDAPLNPKLRKRIPTRTWYPNSPAREGAMAVVLRPGERREGVDIELRKVPSYCMEGTLAGPGGTGALDFQLEAQQPSSGISKGGGLFIASPGGTTAADGRFRVCELHAGTYRLTAGVRGADPKKQMWSGYAVAELTIADQDLRDLKIAAAPGLPLEGEVAWADTPPEKPVDTKVPVSLAPLLRAHFMGEANYARVGIPGAFSFTGVLVDDYAVRVGLSAPGLYIKDVTYAGRSVRREPLRLGTAMRGTGLRISIGRDGATLTARVADKDGSPVADARILLIPADVTSEAILAETLVSGATDQAGEYTTQPLAPGKYLAAASLEPVDAGADTIARLWRARTRFQEVELAPGATARVSLRPLVME